MRIKIIFGTIGLFIGLMIYFSYNPSSSSIFPKCPFLVLTGYKCPGCGSQRVVHSLLHLDIVSAFKYNAFMVASLPIIALLLFAEIKRTTNYKLYSSIQKPIYIWIYFVCVLLWWFLRNIFGI